MLVPIMQIGRRLLVVNKITFSLVLSACAAWVLFVPATASAISGNAYYTFTFDTGPYGLQHFTLAFSESSSSTPGGDNETTQQADNATLTGEVTISADGRSFQDASGTYIANGNFFNGSWQATEALYSPFYETTVYTHHSLLFFGISLAGDVITTGVMYSTTKSEPQTAAPASNAGMLVAMATEEEMLIVPFLGVLVSLSEFP